MQVLIIDDHRDSADMLAALLRLRKPGLTVHVAHDGESALPLALADRYDAVVIDLNLPGMQGDAVAMEIRREWDGVPPILIAVSGSIAEVARHQTSGVFEHALTKPVNVALLLDILARPEPGQ